MKVVFTSLTFKVPVVRNYSTGVYHRGYASGKSLCGHSKKGAFATLSDCKNASPHMFCEHCFQAKPEQFFEEQV